eukprot:9380344-Lingulodinium_polyedra.AAC.1
MKTPTAANARRPAAATNGTARAPSSRGASWTLPRGNGATRATPWATNASAATSGSARRAARRL